MTASIYIWHISDKPLIPFDTLSGNISTCPHVDLHQFFLHRSKFISSKTQSILVVNQNRLHLVDLISHVLLARRFTQNWHFSFYFTLVLTNTWLVKNYRWPNVIKFGIFLSCLCSFLMDITIVLVTRNYQLICVLTSIISHTRYLWNCMNNPQLHK